MDSVAGPRDTALHANMKQPAACAQPPPACAVCDEAECLLEVGQPVLVGMLACFAKASYPKELLRLFSGAVRPRSANFSKKASRSRSKNAKGICLPYASSATTRNAAGSMTRSTCQWRSHSVWQEVRKPTQEGLTRATAAAAPSAPAPLTVACVHQVVERVCICCDGELLITDLRVLQALHGHSAEVPLQHTAFRQHHRVVPCNEAVYEPRHECVFSGV
jgi:hypothetical protein